MYKPDREQFVCGVCGSVQDKNWGRHWDTQHPGLEIFELDEEFGPYESWCDNWHAIMKAELEGKAPPKAVNSKLKSGLFKKGNKVNKRKRDVKASQKEKPASMP